MNTSYNLPVKYNVKDNVYAETCGNMKSISTPEIPAEVEMYAGLTDRLAAITSDIETKLAIILSSNYPMDDSVNESEYRHSVLASGMRDIRYRFIENIYRLENILSRIQL